MADVTKLAQFKVPGGSAGSQDLPVPSGIPAGLRGGLENSGTAFFQTVVNNLIIIGSFLALVMVIIAGTQWIMSKGEPEKLASAKKRFVYAIVGLVIMLSAFFIVQAIIFITGGKTEDFLNPTQLLNQQN